MARTIELSSWKEFEERIEKNLTHETNRMMSGPTLYRGHSDATWPLETTLDRYIETKLSVSTYYRMIAEMKSRLETFTDQKWDIPSYTNFRQSEKKGGAALSDSIIVYMQYLRHFGYPSPLLDWTYSPFIAAYFAFKDLTCKSSSVAIFEFLAASHYWTAGSDPIRVIGKPSSSKRHYLQQSVYTVCFTDYDERGNTYFGSYEKLMDSEYFNDLFIKYVIPISERTRALQSLDAYNINAYSLLGTEESLLETMFLREYKNIEIMKIIDPGHNINW